MSIDCLDCLKSKRDISIKPKKQEIFLSNPKNRIQVSPRLKEIGVDHKLNGLHILKSGGDASAISTNSSNLVSERVLKFHGRTLGVRCTF